IRRTVRDDGGGQDQPQGIARRPARAIAGEGRRRAMSGNGEMAERIAFVTGAGGGIGAALVALLRAEGARVVASDLAAPALEGDDVWPAALDVTDSAAVDALVERVERDWGPIHYGVSMAGVLSTDLVLDTDDATWRRVFDV